MNDKITAVYVIDEKLKNLANLSVASLLHFNKNAKVYALTCRKNVKIEGAQTVLIDVDFKFRRRGKNDRISDAAYLKLWIPEILSEDKILYLDADTVVQKPILDLWNIDINFLGATESHNAELQKCAELGIKKYALSGMMLMNLKSLRAVDFKNACLS